jgi:hypothetical protein
MRALFAALASLAGGENARAVGKQQAVAHVAPTRLHEREREREKERGPERFAEDEVDGTPVMGGAAVAFSQIAESIAPIEEFFGKRNRTVLATKPTKLQTRAKRKLEGGPKPRRTRRAAGRPRRPTRSSGADITG